jgi:hypothetical protein
MPLSGYKDFQTGSVLSEGDIDAYLMQGVLVFADASARNTALGETNNAGGLFAGRAVYLTTPNTLQIYNGTAYVNIATEAFVNSAVAAIRDPLIRLYMDAGLSMM